MPKIEWKNSFSVDIEEIDNQHKELIRIINELVDSLSHNSDSESMRGISKELIDYSEVHFGLEEKYMKQFNYEHYEGHVSEHKYFKEHLDDLITKYPLNSDKTKIDLLNFLKDWLLNHIMDVDKEYVSCFKSNGL